MPRIPLVLLPGTLCTADLWAAQLPALREIADIIVVETTEHDNLAALAKHVHAQFDQPFAVAGLSYGGIVAFEVWRQNPDKITHLGLLNTTPYPVSNAKRKAQEEMVTVAQFGNFYELIAKQSSGVMHKLSTYSKIISMAEKVGPIKFTNQIKAQINRPDSRPILNQINCPTLILTGADDHLCPPEIHRVMAEKIPNSQLHIVSDCGHLSTFDQPISVANIMKAWIGK